MPRCLSSEILDMLASKSSARNFGGDFAGAELDVAVLDAVAIAVRNEATQGVGISHHLSRLITSRCHGGSGLQGSSGGCRNCPATVHIADGLSQVVPVVCVRFLCT
eukprot:Skav209805  [mRNA]  locus=scaffold1201:324840:325916:+ [translate_table: standard]